MKFLHFKDALFLSAQVLKNVMNQGQNRRLSTKKPSI